MVTDALQRRGCQPDDRTLVPLDNYTSNFGVSKDLKDVKGGIANGPGVSGVGTNSDPHNDGPESFVFALLNGLRCEPS